MCVCVVAELAPDSLFIRAGRGCAFLPVFLFDIHSTPRGRDPSNSCETFFGFISTTLLCPSVESRVLPASRINRSSSLYQLNCRMVETKKQTLSLSLPIDKSWKSCFGSPTTTAWIWIFNPLLFHSRGWSAFVLFCFVFSSKVCECCSRACFLSLKKGTRKQKQNPFSLISASSFFLSKNEFQFQPQFWRNKQNLLDSLLPKERERKNWTISFPVTPVCRKN